GPRSPWRGARSPPPPNPRAKGSELHALAHHFAGDRPHLHRDLLRLALEERADLLLAHEHTQEERVQLCKLPRGAAALLRVLRPRLCDGRRPPHLDAELAVLRARGVEELERLDRALRLAEAGPRLAGDRSEEGPRLRVLLLREIQLVGERAGLAR